MFTPQILAFVEILLPADGPENERPVLLRAAGELVQQKITGLTLPMRMAVLLLLVLFDFSALLTIGTRFSAASFSMRQHHLAAAEKWPLIPFRELAKLVRSFTLMAFYDHPLTRKRLAFQPGGLRVAA
jgi:hypothetical protein